MKVHLAIARALQEQGIDTICGLIGDANLYIIDTFIRDCGGRFISSAHESGATCMALAYGQMSGTVGVASVTHGAAVTNTLTGLAHGVKARVPMLLLCGDTAATDRDNFQNIPQREAILSTGAGFEQLRSPETIQEDVATALRRAKTERRPIALNLPVDMQWLDVDQQPGKVRWPDVRTVVPESADLDDAIGIIAAARRPIVLVGRGAIEDDARTAIQRFAERIGAPLATTLQAKDLYRGEDFNLGIFGTLSQDAVVEAIVASDCLIAFGASLNPFTLSHGTFAKGKRIVHVDIDPGQIGRYFTTDVGVVGEAARTADLFVHWLDAAEIEASGGRSKEVAELIATPMPLAGPLPDGRIGAGEAVAIIDRMFTRDRVVVTDGGRFLGEVWKNLTVDHPRDFLITVAFGSIGLGMGHAIGTAAARPGRPVLHVTGDGGWVLGGLSEFHTAVRHKLDVVTVVFNDEAYGAEHIQFRNKGMDPALSMFDWPDFAKVAEAMGGRGFTVRTGAELEAALSAIETRDCPVLIDVRLDPDTMPPFP